MDYFEDPHLCLICFGYHPLKYCKYFKTFTVQQRIYLVRVHRYCPQCFSRSHLFDECTLMAACDKCHGPHHTMLHADSYTLATNAPAATARGFYRRQSTGEPPLHHRCRLHRVSPVSHSRYNERMYPDAAAPAGQHSCRGQRVPAHSNINVSVESEEQQQPTSTMPFPCPRDCTVPNTFRERPEASDVPISASRRQWGSDRYTPIHRRRLSDNEPSYHSSATYRWLHNVQQTAPPSVEHLYEPCCNDYNCPSRSSPPNPTACNESSSFSALNTTWLDSQPHFETSLQSSSSERSCDTFTIGATPPVGRCASDAGHRRLSFSTRRSQPPSTESEGSFDLQGDRFLPITTLRARSPLRRCSTQLSRDDTGDDTGGSSLCSEARAPPADKPMAVIPKRSRSRLTASDASATPQYLGSQSSKPKKEPSSEEESVPESAHMKPAVDIRSSARSGKRCRKGCSADSKGFPVASTGTCSQESVPKPSYSLNRPRRKKDSMDQSSIKPDDFTPMKSPPSTSSSSVTKPHQIHVLQLHEIRIHLQQLLSHLKSPKEYWHTPANRRRQQLMRQQLFQLKCLLRQLIQEVANPRPRCCSPTCTCQQQKTLKTLFQQLLQPLQQCRNLSSTRQLHSCIQQLIEQLQQQQCQDMPPIGGCAAEDRFQDLLEQLQKLEQQCQTTERGHRVELVQQRLRLQIILRQLLKAALDQLTEVLNVVKVAGEVEVGERGEANLVARKVLA